MTRYKKTLEDLSHLFIPPGRFRILERSAFGAGNYGDVFRGVLDETSSTARGVAIKRLKATREHRVRLAKVSIRHYNWYVHL